MPCGEHAPWNGGCDERQCLCGTGAAGREHDAGDVTVHESLVSWATVSISARRRAHDSNAVNGHGELKSDDGDAQATVGTCNTMVRGQRSARKPPIGKYMRYAKWAPTVATTAAKYIFFMA